MRSIRHNNWPRQGTAWAGRGTVGTVMANLLRSRTRGRVGSYERKSRFARLADRIGGGHLSLIAILPQEDFAAKTASAEWHLKPVDYDKYL